MGFPFSQAYRQVCRKWRVPLFPSASSTRTAHTGGSLIGRGAPGPTRAAPRPTYWGEGAPPPDPARTVPGPRVTREGGGRWRVIGSLRVEGLQGLLVYSKQCVDSSFHNLSNIYWRKRPNLVQYPAADSSGCCELGVFRFSCFLLLLLRLLLNKHS